MKHPLRILSNRGEGRQDAQEAGVRFTARPSKKYEGCCGMTSRHADTGNQKLTVTVRGTVMTGSPCSHLSCTLWAELVPLNSLRNAAVHEVWFHPPQCHLADLTHATLFNLIHRDQVLLLELGRARIQITGGSVLKMDLKKTWTGGQT